VYEAVREDAAANGHQCHQQRQIEHVRRIAHQLLELVGDAEWPAEVPGDPGDLVRDVGEDCDEHRAASPVECALRRLPVLLWAVASSAAQAEVAGAAVVGEGGGCPEQAADEHQDEVHPVPVEDVAEAVLLPWYASEGEHEQGGRQGNHREQGVVGDQ
jgi:hypothetical protein